MIAQFLTLQYYKFCMSWQHVLHMPFKSIDCQLPNAKRHPGKINYDHSQLHHVINSTRIAGSRPYKRATGLAPYTVQAIQRDKHSIYKKDRHLRNYITEK